MRTTKTTQVPSKSPALASVEHFVTTQILLKMLAVALPATAQVILVVLTPTVAVIVTDWAHPRLDNHRIKGACTIMDTMPRIMRITQTGLFASGETTTLRLKSRSRMKADVPLVSVPMQAWILVLTTMLTVMLMLLMLISHIEAQLTSLLVKPPPNNLQPLQQREQRPNPKNPGVPTPTSTMAKAIGQANHMKPRHNSSGSCTACSTTCRGRAMHRLFRGRMTGKLFEFTRESHS
mmetsp:Transcript_16178/g.44819  ORF Transcript_16178/g.44819 Transcript_16178/m.44819 type:complete len:235 (-) Transcript_16178:2021-2725(-)